MSTRGPETGIVEISPPDGRIVEPRSDSRSRTDAPNTKVRGLRLILAGWLILTFGALFYWIVGGSQYGLLIVLGAAIVGVVALRAYRLERTPPRFDQW